MGMIPIVALVTILGVHIIVHCEHVNEAQMMEYLEAVGNASLRDYPHNSPPLHYINHVKEGWSIVTPCVKEFVAIVCRRFTVYGEAPTNPYQAACAVFERLAGHYLAGLMRGMRRESKRTFNVLRHAVSSGTADEHKITYPQTREMFEIVCSKLITGVEIPGLEKVRAGQSTVLDATDACKRLINDAIDYLTQLQGSGISSTHNCYRNTITSSQRIGSTLRYDALKTLLPGICDDKDNEDVWNRVYMACLFFDHNAALHLDPHPQLWRTSKLPIGDARPFIVNICEKDAATVGKYKTRCDYLLKEHMEFVLEA